MAATTTTLTYLVTPEIKASVKKKLKEICEHIKCKDLLVKTRDSLKIVLIENFKVVFEEDNGKSKSENIEEIIEYIEIYTAILQSFSEEYGNWMIAKEV